MKFKSLFLTMALALVACLAMPTVALADKPDPKPITLCVDDVTGLPVKTNSPSGRCPHGSHEVTNGLIGSLEWLNLTTPKRQR